MVRFQAKDQTSNNARAFGFLPAGGCVNLDFTYRRTKETGVEWVEGKVHFRDLHATALHLLGLTHEHLGYVQGGRSIRITGVRSGAVVPPTIA